MDEDKIVTDSLAEILSEEYAMKMDFDFLVEVPTIMGDEYVDFILEDLEEDK
jgi:hypothetical protein